MVPATAIKIGKRCSYTSLKDKEDYSASPRDITTRRPFPRYGPYGIRKILDIERLGGERHLQSESSVEIMRRSIL